MFEQLFTRYNPWWESEYYLKDIIKRPKVFKDFQKAFEGKSVVFLTGLRRVGKTTLMKLLIASLLEKPDTDPRHIFYVSLDDYLLAGKSLFELIDEYRKMHKISFREKIFLFFDEIAFQKDFELQLKNLYDSQQVKIVASSSSASILKSKKPYLTGRYVTLEVQPLDFEEYLDFKKIKVSLEDQQLLEGYFEDFLKTGGIPQYVLEENIEYLKELVDDIIYKDIAAVHNITQPHILRDFFLLLMERAGKVMSINKMAHILGISPDTAKRYLALFADTYLIHLVSRCGKTNQRLLAPKKIYASDLGIRNLFTGFRDEGSLFENYVFLKILKRSPCYVYEDGHEIDFYTADKTLIEVKYNREVEKPQNDLFEKFPAKQKLMIKSLGDLRKLEF